MTIALRLYTGPPDSPAPEPQASNAAAMAASRRPPFADVIDAYLAERQILHEAGQLNAKRFQNERRHLISFKTHFGHMTAGELSGRTILAKWLILNPQWKAADSKKDAVGTICAAFEWAADDDRGGLIDRNPFKRRNVSSLIPPVVPRTPVYDHQAEKILAVAKTRGYTASRLAFRFAIHFLFQTGARPCELRSVRWEHVRWNKRTIALPAELAKTGKKTGARLIALTDLMFRLLRWAWHRRGHPTHGEIFLNGRGDPLKVGSFADYFRGVADAAGLPQDATAGGMRHGFCLRHLDAGESSKNVADLMGHSTSAQVERVYGNHLRDEKLRETLKRSGKSGKA